ncbi:hypothetical protein KY084_15275 [Stakelama sp. CBK3Z-3]|uniref:Uncharacterized protein n=1 Tax=Stakelama flava TaxID=2860338 RepID=A0ABS6XS21_9SPHN|nr:hypothetical protein [Stakelama flava]MBW4332221.1 hypothetical protein [Stakelama flava]
MLNKRVAAARAVRETFLPAEQAQDEAAITATRSLLTALEARRSANLHIVTGYEAIAHMSKAAALAVEARDAMIRAHEHLASLPGQIGLQPRMYGETSDECVRETFTGASRPRSLEAVA